MSTKALRRSTTILATACAVAGAAAPAAGAHSDYTAHTLEVTAARAGAPDYGDELAARASSRHHSAIMTSHANAASSQ
jgi:hypothetical protein